jgi:PAS domain S-box-containing protein
MDPSSSPDSHRPKLAESGSDELDKVLDRLLDLTLTLTVSLGSIVVAASLTRWVQKGWHPQHLVHLGVYLVFLLTYLLRKRVSRSVRVAGLIAPLWMNGAANLIFQGFAGSGSLFLSMACVLAVVLFGFRAALAALVASTAVIVMVAVTDSRASGTEWLAHGSAFVGLVAGGVLLLNVVHRTLRQRTVELEREVVERRRVESQLSEREQKYRLLTDNSRDLVVTLDAKGNFTYASPACLTMFGYSPEEVLGRNFCELLAPATRERAGADFQKNTRQTEPRTGALPLIQYQCQRKDGTTFWGELRASRAGDKGFLGVLRDISDRQAAEARRLELENQLQQAERLKAIGQLAGGIAHDFNNQLTGMMGFAELLKANRGDDPLVREYAEGILAPGRRATDLTKKLLAFARRGQYRREPVDLHTIVREVISLLKRSIDKNITVVEAMTAARSTMIGDPTLLQSAVLNLALNARDAMPKGGTLTFQTEQRGPSEILLRVEDTGHGMDAETLRRAFEPFFTTKEVGRGTGMGLPAVQGTVQQHGGSIDIQSVPERGTTVTLRLPLAETTDSTPAMASAAVVEGKGHVLLVEDENTVRDMMARVLPLLGYKVTACADGPEAICAYQTVAQTIDLVLLDMILPAMSGAEVFRALREQNPRVKILIFSGYSADHEARELLSQGALGIVQKPVTIAELSEHLAKAMAAG